MVGVERIDGGPRSVIVVGTGIVGLSTIGRTHHRRQATRSPCASSIRCAEPDANTSR